MQSNLLCSSLQVKNYFSFDAVIPGEQFQFATEGGDPAHPLSVIVFQIIAGSDALQPFPRNGFAVRFIGLLYKSGMQSNRVGWYYLHLVKHENNCLIELVNR